MSSTGILYLVPVPINEPASGDHIPEYNFHIIASLKKFIAEDARTARRHLKILCYPDLPAAEFLILNQHTAKNDLGNLIKDLINGEDVGLMSDAGCPGIADPGAEVVALAHARGIRVVPLVGPSSIVLGIMASGFNGQNFAFVGYLPVDKTSRVKRLKELEQLAYKSNQAQFFIETPYRNEVMFDDLMVALSAATRLFIGKNLTSADEMVRTGRISDWKKITRPSLHKVPVIFGIFK
jgi:16S rRNA (cytidine1402-2'-O)-methyltransferase